MHVVVYKAHAWRMHIVVYNYCRHPIRRMHAVVYMHACTCVVSAETGIQISVLKVPVLK